MSSSKDDFRINKNDAEWRETLTQEQYNVTRCGGTEHAFTGPYWDNKAAGRYDCICCATPLFLSDTKYDSGTGWPSFYAPIEESAITNKDDHSHGMRRTETVCTSCGAHLGHVFPDGPPPTGLRYCMNGTSLNFVPEANIKK